MGAPSRIHPESLHLGSSLDHNDHTWEAAIPVYGYLNTVAGLGELGVGTDTP